MLAALSFQDVEILERFDCFANTSVSKGVSPKVWPHGANVFARKA